jgi:glycosyltransferase involved in cell wall biosynthesis
VLGADVSMAAAVPEVDVIHAHTWYAQFAGIIAGRLLDVPTVVTAHSLEPDRPWKAEQLGGGYRVSSWIEKTAYEQADAVIAVSEAMIANIQAAYPGVARERIHVVKNGIDPEEFKPDHATDVVDSLGIDRTARSWCSSAGSRGRRASSTSSGRHAPSIPTPSWCCSPARPTRRRSPPSSTRPSASSRRPAGHG